MSFDFSKIRQSKRQFRERLAALPIVEKLAILDDLRERALALRQSRSRSQTTMLHEPTQPYELPGENRE